LLVDDVLGIARWGVRAALSHATVMPKARSKYKYEILDFVA
jgi:hypothetical protein